MPATIRTLSQLPELSSGSELHQNAVFEVSIPVEIKLEGDDRIYKFASRKISEKNLAQKMVSEVRNDLIENNGLSEGISVNVLCSTLDRLINGPDPFVLKGEKDFKSNPKIDNAPLSNCSIIESGLDEYSVNFGTLKKYSNINASPSIGPNFGFVTQLSGKRSGSNDNSRYLNLFKINNSNHTATNMANFVFDQTAKNIAQTEYIFQIETGTKSSKAWTAPASGIFTCYGWLDEMNNPSQANESRWVALMGRQAQLDVWTILQVKPFIKNNYLSYVGFTFPVKKGMELKVVTGFAVGSNSDKYFAATGSLANHMPNAFLGGIYTGLSAVNETGNPYDYENITSGYAKLEDLSSLLSTWQKHEDDCDLSTKSLIDELSGKLDSDSSDGACVKYIDAANYNTAMYTDTCQVRYTTLNFGAGKLCVANNVGVFKSNVKQSGWYGRTTDGKFPALSINWADSANGMIRVPEPFHTTTDEFGETTYHGYDYKLAEIPPGSVFSDGKYLYYCVSQDSTVLIDLFEDWADTDGEWTCCRLLFGQNKVSSYKNIRTIMLGTQWEEHSGNGPGRRIAVPLKKGNILMFAIYAREQFPNSTVSERFQQLKAVNEGYVGTELSALLTAPAYYSVSADFTGTANGTKVTSRLWTYRLNMDGSNLNTVFKTSANDTSKGSAGQEKKSFATSFGTIARITEMP